jgi:hypothetical protein
LRIKDVAKVELGAFNYGTKNIAMGKEGVVVGFPNFRFKCPRYHHRNNVDFRRV